MFNCIHFGVLHKHLVQFVLHSHKIAGHFHDVAGSGTSGKNVRLSGQKLDGWQVLIKIIKAFI